MAEDPRQPVVVAAACDGACSGNPGPGGWGCLLRFDDGSVEELGGADPSTTNNRMELTACLAVLERLRELPRSPDLRIRTDSRYLIDGYSRWMSGWKRKGWRTASGSPVLNRDLWEALDAARLPGVTLEHVRGHNGDPDNERCDAIAVAWSRGQQPTPAPAIRHRPLCSGCSADSNWPIGWPPVAMASAWWSWPSWWNNPSADSSNVRSRGAGATGRWNPLVRGAGACGRHCHDGLAAPDGAMAGPR